MPARSLIPSSLATLLVLATILVTVVVVGTAVQAAHRGIPTGTPPPVATPFGSSLYVADPAGPPVEILIGGRLVASVPCRGGAMLIPGQDDVRPLPWSLDVRRAPTNAFMLWPAADQRDPTRSTDAAVQSPAQLIRRFGRSRISQLA